MLKPKVLPPRDKYGRFAKSKKPKKPRPERRPADQPTAAPPQEGTGPAERVQTTPWPRAADNQDFEGLLDQVAATYEPKAEPSAERESAGLQSSDVAEWVKWPFDVWASSQKLPALKISTQEAESVAEPLTRLLNRHGVAEAISPDVLDSMQVIGRLTPIMSVRIGEIKAERARRAQAGQHSSQGSASRARPVEPQGVPLEEARL